MPRLQIFTARSGCELQFVECNELSNEVRRMFPEVSVAETDELDQKYRLMTLINWTQQN